MSLLGHVPLLRDVLPPTPLAFASKEHVHARSKGEVKKPETINYRTLKPERDGLFCASIFGPTDDHVCLCGKYEGEKYDNVVCEKCGVEVGLASMRDTSFGHVDLAVPCVHPWLEDFVASLLGWSKKDLARVEYYEVHVSDEGTITTEEQLLEDGTYEMGGRALEALVAKKTGEKNVLITALAVMPPGLRPLVPLEGGRWATSDVNDLYRRVINRNNRLKRLQELNAPEIILRNEARMLQEAIDALYDNERREKIVTGPNRRPLVSIGTMVLRALEKKQDASLLLEAMGFLTKAPIEDAAEKETPPKIVTSF